MRLGALLGPIVTGAPAHALADQARRYEAAGFESLWSAQAIGRGFMLTDPFVALSVAAAVTDVPELGTAVVQVPLYEPFDLAHRVFSLQQVCGKRLVLGVGAGSTESDFAALGRNYRDRFGAFQHTMAALEDIFAAGGDGDRQLSPWPEVAGGPPVLLGTWGKGVVQAARSFDGWIASAMHRSPDQILAALDGYRDAGGSRAVVSTIRVPPGADLPELRALLARFDAAGFDDAVVMIMPGGPDPDQVRALAP